MKYNELNKTEQWFVMEYDFFGIDDEDNVIDSNGGIVEDHMDILREMEHYTDCKE